MSDVETLRTKYEALAPVLNERTRRLWPAAKAETVGRGGIAMVARDRHVTHAYPHAASRNSDPTMG